MERKHKVQKTNPGANWNKLIAFTLVILGISGGAGCGTLPRNPVPLEKMSVAEVAGMSGVRAWGGRLDQAFQQDLLASVKQEQLGMFRHADGTVAYSVLSLSGGGQNGAFAAGFLKGWTGSGKRPVFKLVTGISTGALIAPFAFLGQDYDQLLEKYYTGIRSKDIFKMRSLLEVFGKDSIADSKPLAGLIAKLVDKTMLKKIAEAHAQGLRLYIGTANLDAENIVVWNMGLIASSGHPKALDLFRSVMLASASIPIVFSPVYIAVEVDGNTYDEMHVDGGTLNQVFFYAGILNLNQAAEEMGVLSSKIKGAIYIIRSGKLDSEAKQTERKLKEIVPRTVSAMIKAQALGDLYRIYAFTKRDSIDFNYVGIPEDYEWVSTEEFDPVEMKRLFDLGYKVALSKNPWMKTPPGLAETSR
ncbi:MAG: patatin-like phospholipase family protein [Deltaproteobacteria bacterium]|nr:patatin-like phospholipase family protein [Deltaproteobacteria bacterium]